MEGPFPLRCLADGGMDELACRIVAANAQGLVVRAFPGNMTVIRYTSPAYDKAGTRLLGRGRISWLTCRYKVVRI